jgi:Mg/Co/Ni transporter MgtE
MTSTPELAIAYITKSPESAGRVLSSMPSEASAAFIGDIPTQYAVKVVAKLQPTIAAKILQTVKITAAAAIMQDLDFGSASAIVRGMDRTNRNQLLSNLPKRIRAALEKSLSFAPGTVGAYMTTTIATLSAKDNVASALDIIKQTDRDHIDVVFVLNDNRCLSGAVSSAIALRHPTETVLSEIMDTSCPSVSAHSRLEAVSDPVIWHDLALLPVVNSGREVVGAISRKALNIALQSDTTRVNLAGPSMLASVFMALKVTSTGLMNLVSASLTDPIARGERDEH